MRLFRMLMCVTLTVSLILLGLTADVQHVAAVRSCTVGNSRGECTRRCRAPRRNNVRGACPHDANDVLCCYEPGHNAGNSHESRPDAVDDTSSSSTPSGRTAPAGKSCPAYRSVVAKYFKAKHVEWALAVIFCESTCNSNARNSSRTRASGLFQQLPRFWGERSAAAGRRGANIFDVDANIAVSAALLYGRARARGGPQHWECHNHNAYIKRLWPGM